MSDLLIHGLKGGAKALALYCVPTVLLFRRRPAWRTAAYAVIFVALTRILSRAIKQQQQRAEQQHPSLLRRYADGVAGAVAAAAALALLEPSATAETSLRRSSLLASAVAVRAVRTAVPWTHWSLPVLVMCASASQVLSTWLAAPREMDASYRAFLNVFGGKGGVSAVPLPLPNGQTGHSVYDAMGEWAINKVPLPPGVSACDVIHAGNGRACLSHFAWFTVAGLRRAVRMYAALHTVFMLVKVARLLLRADKAADGDHKRASTPQRLAALLRAELAPLAVRIGKSSLFLALYCSTAWLSACMAYRFAYPYVSRATLASHTWVAGLPVLLEAPSRRLELASYCAVYGVDTTWRQLNAWLGRSSARPDLVIGTLILSAGVLMQNHRQHGDFISRWLLELDAPQNFN